MKRRFDYFGLKNDNTELNTRHTKSAVPKEQNHFYKNDQSELYFLSPYLCPKNTKHPYIYIYTLYNNICFIR